MLPILYIDVDGVLSLFSSPHEPTPIRPDTHFLNVEGIGHLIALDNCRRLGSLFGRFEFVWATGWEEKANDNLLGLVGLDAPLDVIRFSVGKYDNQAHWKLGALEAHAGDRPIAWVDDALDDECRAWADQRRSPTLLVETQSHEGITDRHVDELVGWAGRL